MNLPYPTYRYVLGYHAGERSNLEKVVANPTSFHLSQNEHEWLGKGIYFFEHSRGIAEAWATMRTKRPSPSNRKVLRDPAIVWAIIDLGNCLDLMEPSHSVRLGKVFPTFLQVLERQGRSRPSNRSAHKKDRIRTHRYLDCKMINWFAEGAAARLRPFQTVRAGFQKGKPIYPGSAIHEKTHVEIAVRDPTVIKCMDFSLDSIQDAAKLWA
jgi:hypothetical protein